MTEPRGDLEDLWRNVDVRFRTYAPRESAEVAPPVAAADAPPPAEAPAPFDPLRCEELEAELGRKRPVSRAEPANSAPAAAPASAPVRRRRSREARAAAAKPTVECTGDLKACRLVDGLMILGRADVRAKRLLKAHGGDAPIAVGGDIDAAMAARMRRSLDYSKRANRPRIICSSVAKYRLAAR